MPPPTTSRHRAATGGGASGVTNHKPLRIHSRCVRSRRCATGPSPALVSRASRSTWYARAQMLHRDAKHDAQQPSPPPVSQRALEKARCCATGLTLGWLPAVASLGLGRRRLSVRARGGAPRLGGPRTPPLHAAGDRRRRHTVGGRARQGGRHAGCARARACGPPRQRRRGDGAARGGLFGGHAAGGGAVRRRPLVGVLRERVPSGGSCRRWWPRRPQRPARVLFFLHLNHGCLHKNEA